MDSVIDHPVVLRVIEWCHYAALKTPEGQISPFERHLRKVKAMNIFLFATVFICCMSRHELFISAIFEKRTYPDYFGGLLSAAV